MSQIAEVKIDSGYEAAKSGVAWYSVLNPGTLLIGGATRVDYLQRQTTNDLGLLSSTRALPNILTSASGRVLEVFTLLQLSEQILLVSQPGHGSGLAVYFKKNLFFNDQVSIVDVSSDWVQIELRGPQSAHLLTHFGPAATPALDETVAFDLNGEAVYIIGIDSFDTNSAFTLLAPTRLSNELTKRLADLGAVALSATARDLLRIEAGRAGDPEFIYANTPFEIGLSRYVSDSKGCYTGQEVLARQVTYDKIVRSLALLSTERPVAAGEPVTVDGKTVGTISSTAISSASGPLALAVLRKPFEAAGISLQIGTIKAKVI